MKKNYMLFSTLFIYAITSVYPQNNPTSKVDSLTTLLKTDKEDTNKVNHLNDLCWEYINIGQYDSALYSGNAAGQLSTFILNETENPAIKQAAQKGMAVVCRYIGLIYFYQDDYPKALEYHFKALEINEELGNKNGIAKNLTNIGNVYNYQGDYSKTLEYYSKALKINEELENKNGTAAILGNIGFVYYQQGDYPEALEYHFKALRINEKVGDKNAIATNLSNIGNVYNHQGDHYLALKYYFKALEITEKLGDKNGTAPILGNIGNAYSDQGDLLKALEYHFKSLKINEEFVNNNAIATNLRNIGTIYGEQANYPKALEYFFKSLKINEELGNKKGIATSLGNIGEAYAMEKKYKEGEMYLLKALATSTGIGALYLIQFHHKALSELYSQTNRYQLAYEHYKQFTIAKDSLFNEEKSKEIGRLEMRHEIEMAEMERKRKAAEELKIITQKIERRNLLQFSGMFIGLLIIGLLVTLLGFVKVKQWVAEGITFFVFLLFFEFLLVLLDPYMDKFTRGEPAYKLFINAGVALCIFPMHALFEKMLKKRLIK